MGTRATKGNKGREKGEKTKSKKHSLTVLTLGISGSGKSTFAKQMKILYSGGFTDEEKVNYKDILLKNTLIGMQELVKQVGKLELTVKEENRKKARYFLEMNVVDEPWTPETGQKLRVLWQDPAIQQAWERAPEYQLQMSTMEYHMERLDQYTSDGYVPTNEDMLRARQRTTGAVDTIFEIDKTEWKFLDCGGQKPERNKWEILLNENPTNAIIFFAALDEFNMASSEEPGKNKMQIATECFKELVASKQTKALTFVLFLNKKDLFEKKLKRDFDEFQKTFPKYTGGKELKPATEFIGNQFRAVMKDEGRAPEELYVHVTCALDTDAMDTVFQAVRETLFLNNLMMGGVKM